MAGESVVLDDRLLIEELLVGLDAGAVDLHTTEYWYYRACRAAVIGAGGHLSGPFLQLGATEQNRAILALLDLRSDISLACGRSTVLEMARLASRHPRLNLMNLEAVSLGKVLGATVWMSAEAARGVLPAVLDAEDVSWRVQSIDP